MSGVSQQMIPNIKFAAIQIIEFTHSIQLLLRRLSANLECVLSILRRGTGTRMSGNVPGALQSP